MSDYYNNHNRQKKKRNRYEKIGFYTAFSICLVAVAMAVFSTYMTIKESEPKAETQSTLIATGVNNNVTGITEEATEQTSAFTVPTVAATSNAQYPTQFTEEPENDTRSALQTMLSTNLSLSYPLNHKNIIREYSEETVYYKTLNVWKPHTGVDFAGALSEDVYAMTGGAVTKVYEDKLYGKTVEISTDDAVVIYSGVNGITVAQGDSVDTGAKIGVVGSVPCEAEDENHIHISVKVDGKYADPLSFIGNDE